ncbi:MAG TPA: M23 family metallopeptidase [Spirochaetia bacterium]|nr:M23 family metallopeptidase [Spirochaetia bacterium]
MAAVDLQTLVLLSYVAFIFLAGSWVFASFYLRYAILVLAVLAIVRSFARAYALPLFVEPRLLGWIGYATGLMFSAAMIFLAVGAIRSFWYPEVPLRLSFPFRHGVYAVFEGGNGKASSLMNYHYSAAMHRGAGTNASMRYATDLTRLSRWGNDADGFLPTRNERYAVFHEVVYSPLEGEVSDVEDSWPNETPWTGDPPYNVGNHILITSNGYGVLLGHLQKGSILVKPGDRVSVGQPVARAGNSGWTSQPHLHLQAMRISAGSFWGWEGVPVSFEGKNPTKNRLFFTR